MRNGRLVGWPPTYRTSKLLMSRRLPRLLLPTLALLGLSGMGLAQPPHAAARRQGPMPPSLSRVEQPAEDDEVSPAAETTEHAADAVDVSQQIESRLQALAATSTSAAELTDDIELTQPIHERLSAIVGKISTRARVGIAVRDLATGRLLFEYDADESFNPASNQKLLTATAAVELLGADFRFETRVLREENALILVGGGDPSLQVEDVQDLAAKVARTDLEGIERIVVDDSAFSQRRFGPGYDTEGPGYSYLAPSGALSLQFNTVEITVRGTAAGQPPTVTVEPDCAHLSIRNLATTGGRKQRLSVTTHAHDTQTVVAVGGHLRAGSTIRLRRRITDPGHFTGSTFAATLAQHLGSEPLPVQRGEAGAQAEPIAVHRSGPLTEVLGSALKYSNNFTTEQVLRTLGHLHSGQPGDWDNGRVVLERFWTAIGQDPERLVLENGAGMSRRGRVTPRALAGLLTLLAQEDREAARVVEAMPVAGQEGTLRGRLRSTGGRVRAKTGTLSGASGLTGVISDAAGQPRLGFSVLVNGRVSSRSARRLQDRVVLALVDHLEE